MALMKIDRDDRAVLWVDEIVETFRELPRHATMPVATRDSKIWKNASCKHSNAASETLARYALDDRMLELGAPTLTH